MLSFIKQTAPVFDIVVGPGTKVSGDIYSERSVRIDGVVEGNIHALGKVIISEIATVRGDVISDSAEIQGTCDGSILSRGKVVLLSKSIVHGDIEAQSFSTFDGATFNGKCSINPLSTLEINIPFISSSRSEQLRLNDAAEEASTASAQETSSAKNKEQKKK